MGFSTIQVASGTYDSHLSPFYIGWALDGALHMPVVDVVSNWLGVLLQIEDPLRCCPHSHLNS